MERIYPKEPEKISLLEAAKLMEFSNSELFVLHPEDETRKKYVRQTLEEFLEDCMFFVER